MQSAASHDIYVLQSICTRSVKRSSHLSLALDQIDDRISVKHPIVYSEYGATGVLSIVSLLPWIEVPNRMGMPRPRCSHPPLGGLTTQMLLLLWMDEHLGVSAPKGSASKSDTRHGVRRWHRKSDRRVRLHETLSPEPLGADQHIWSFIYHGIFSSHEAGVCGYLGAKNAEAMVGVSRGCQKPAGGLLISKYHNQERPSSGMIGKRTLFQQRGGSNVFGPTIDVEMESIEESPKSSR
jgi:hypothetical protein